MAEVLDEFNFGRMRSSGGSSYDQFLDGQIWKLTSEDSPTGTADIRSMQSSIAAVARRKNLDLKTNIITEGKKAFLVIQATPKEEE